MHKVKRILGIAGAVILAAIFGHQILGFRTAGPFIGLSVLVTCIGILPDYISAVEDNK